MTGVAARVWGRLKHRWILSRLAGPKVLRAFAASHPDAFFVEIGANDGEQGDHLHDLVHGGRWRGIMVEPVPYVFERLRSNYAGLGRIALENAAIGAEDGTLPFFHMRQVPPDERATLPEWYDALGSFSRETITTHAPAIPDIEERIVTTEVPVLTFDSLLARHGVAGVDLVVVDTEGYDWEILRSIDLARHRPRLIVYEHFHLVPEDRAACAAHLRAAGYETMEEGFDTFCLDTTRDDALTRRWRRLRPAVAGLSKHEGA